MRGKPGTRVDIIVLRGDNELEFNIIRANIVMQSVRSEVLNEISAISGSAPLRKGPRMISKSSCGIWSWIALKGL
jgi:hypothetical protein